MAASPATEQAEIPAYLCWFIRVLKTDFSPGKLSIFSLDASDIPGDMQVLCKSEKSFQMLFT